MNGQSDRKTPIFFDPARSSLAPGAGVFAGLAERVLAMSGPCILVVALIRHQSPLLGDTGRWGQATDAV